MAPVIVGSKNPRSDRTLFTQNVLHLIDSISDSDNAISALGQGTVVYAYNRATAWSNEKTREGQSLDEKTADDKQLDIAHVFHNEQFSFPRFVYQDYVFQYFCCFVPFPKN